MNHLNRARSWGVALSCAIAGLAVASLAQAATRTDVVVSNPGGGIARVSFVNPESFVDARDSSGHSEANLKVLSQHLQRLARRTLGQGEVLQIEVLDVDLAGRVWPFRVGPEMRVIRDTTDWPRIKLRYVLEANGVVLRRGEETLTDMNFMSGNFGNVASEPLPYEKRMLTRWFTKRFVANTPADH